MLEEDRRRKMLGLATKPCRLSGEPAVAAGIALRLQKLKPRRHLKMFHRITDIWCRQFPKKKGCQGCVISAQIVSWVWRRAGLGKSPKLLGILRMTSLYKANSKNLQISLVLTSWSFGLTPACMTSLCRGIWWMLYGPNSMEICYRSPSWRRWSLKSLEKWVLAFWTAAKIRSADRSL